MSSTLRKELIFLILQYLEEENFKETRHKLEQECGFFFNMKYFEKKVMNGEWEEVEKYLGGFITVYDNRHSMKIFFEIRKQKYLEALDRHDKPKALDILLKDLKVFSTLHQELYKEIAQLLTLDNFRENEQLSDYGDTKLARSMVILVLKKVIEENPLIRDKLILPPFKASRLRTLINHSLYWQHHKCKNPRPNPDIKSLLTDHTCSPPNEVHALTPVTAVAKPSSFSPLGGPLQPDPTASHINTIMNANSSSCIQTPALDASSLPGPPNQGKNHEEEGPSVGNQPQGA